VTRNRKLAYTALLFAAALLCVALASSSRSVGPLFLAWVPLLSVPYLLTRAEPRPVDATPGDGPEGDSPADD
jgi:hypothetical protein